MNHVTSRERTYHMVVSILGEGDFDPITHATNMTPYQESVREKNAYSGGTLDQHLGIFLDPHSTIQERVYGICYDPLTGMEKGLV